MIANIGRAFTTMPENADMDMNGVNGAPISLPRTKASRRLELVVICPRLSRLRRAAITCAENVEKNIAMLPML